MEEGRGRKATTKPFLTVRGEREWWGLHEDKTEIFLYCERGYNNVSEEGVWDSFPMRMMLHFNDPIFLMP